MIGCGSLRNSLNSKLPPLNNEKLPQKKHGKKKIPKNIVVEETYAAPDQNPKSLLDPELKIKTFVKQTLNTAKRIKW